MGLLSPSQMAADSRFYSHLQLGPSAYVEENKESQLYIHHLLLKETNKITLLSREKFWKHIDIIRTWNMFVYYHLKINLIKNETIFPFFVD